MQIPAARYNSIDDLFDDPHLNAIGFFETVETHNGPVRFPGVPTWFSRTPAKVAGPTPRLGEGSESIMAELAAAQPKAAKA